MVGYSQSRSTPWNPQVSMNSTREVIKAARVCFVEHMSDQVLNVGPWSLNSKPPIEIQVCNSDVFSAVNWEYRITSEGSVGVMLKNTGSIAAKAKLRCVRPSVMICEGWIRLHTLYRIFLKGHYLSNRCSRASTYEDW